MTLSLFSNAAPAGRPLRIALAGYGVVGQALVATLAGDPRFRIDSILVRDPARARAVPPPVPPTGDRAAFAATPADVLVDALSSPDTAASLGVASLRRGTDLVSAGKQAIVAAYAELREAAAASGARLRYGAAVGGEAPVLETVARARAAGGVREVTGVLNGTVNHLLGRLAAGSGFAAALAEARAAGFAEEDCAADLTGADAAAKLRLIAAEAWGVVPASVRIEADALDAAAAERIAASGEPWVQASSLRRTGEGPIGRVRLCPRRLVPRLPAVEGEWNCAIVLPVHGPALRCIGRGAGGPPTASAILADLEVLLAARGAEARPRAIAC